MRGVLPTRLSAVVEAARMDVLCAAPPLADGASAASWRNHLATHGRTLKLGGGTCQSAPLNQKLQNRPLFSHYPFLLIGLYIGKLSVTAKLAAAAAHRDG
jgi:hypothetical protein